LVLIALIPAYRPEPILVSIVQSLLEDNFSAVVIVNDGSGSNYNSVFYNISNLDGVDVIHHAINLGKGAALKSGINHICNKWNIKAGIVTVDADGQHKVNDIKNIAKELEQNSQNLILGARNFSGDVPFKSWLGNELTRFLMKIVHRLKLSDTQTGLRGFSAESAINFLSIRSNRYDFELDMLLLANKLDLPITEIPIETVYIDNNRSSHFNPIFDSAKIYFSLFRFSSAGVIAALIDNLIFFIMFFFGFSILGSQICGRFVASIVNYLMVKNIVFHSSESHSIALPKYIAAVIILGLLSYSLILLSAEYLPLPVMLAKIFAEALIFLASYLVQKTFIFKENRI